jgi:hypothetical protein
LTVVNEWIAGAFKVAGSKEDVEVAGWLFGDLAIDFRMITDDTDEACWGWSITHVPTGLAIMTLAMGADEVRPLVEELAGFTDWGEIRGVHNAFLKKRVRALMDRFPGLVFRVDQTIPPWARYDRRGSHLRVVK